MEYNGLVIKKKCDELKKNIKLFEDNQINSYYYLSNVGNYWIDNNARLFSNKINDEKKNIDIFICELKKMCYIFEYIYKEYSNIGDSFKFSFNNLNYVYNSIDKYIKNIDDIINIYNNFPIQYLDYFIDQKNYFINLKKNILLIKNDLSKKNDKIFNVENHVSSMLSNFDVELIKISNVDNLM